MNVELKQDNYIYNKKEMIQRNKDYRANNVEKLTRVIKCECGLKYQHQSKARHNRSKRHIKHVEDNLNLDNDLKQQL
jgi:hypothetical protein